MFSLCWYAKMFAIAINRDKVMHILKSFTVKCNTFSRGYYGRCFQDQRTTRYSLHKATMLDDQTAGNRTELFHSVGSPIPYGSGILQQLHAQWEVVYAPLDSQLQSGRTLVLPRNRLFPGRQFNQNVDCPHCKQSRRNNCGTIRRKTPLSLPCSAGAVVQEEKTTTPEDRALIYLSRCRSSYCGQTTSSNIRAKLTYTAITSGNCSSGPGGIYPQSRSQFCAVSKKHQTRHEGNHRGCTNRTILPAICFKKNDANCGAASWRALNFCLQQLAQETSPAALFSRPPVVRFATERTVCHCGKQLMVQKTHRKTVLSMTGPFVAHETVLHCPSCSHIFGSDALQQLVPKWCNIGYDVLVFVGRALFQRYRTIQEVSAE